ncbi:Arachidonate 5-lipoxygenase [Fasciolopsis buskii]|uniref:Arachidonate 5-lipoxygenase n=1 Tax=Fasciolopsis buskii TaxID=27845 RepID=A0A8E0S1F2_9TREM|nr:Arachidonate 5-lipoxygenase [Fasciolopsis buski]
MGGNSTKIAFEVCVVSGDYSGDELGPGVNMVMFDSVGNQSPTITLANIFQNESDYTQAKFTIDLQPWSKLKVFRRLHHIEFWCTAETNPPPAWFLDRVIIRDRRFGMTAEWKYFFFPVHQWISPDHQYVVHDCESWLPVQDPFPDLRDAELSMRLQFFTFFQRAKGLPVELHDIPPSEYFTSDSRWSIESLVLEVIERYGLAPEYTSQEPWNSLDELGSFYKRYNVTEPMSLQFWMMNDICFGAQRIRGCNPFMIRLCRQLPESFAAAATWIKPHLEGWTLKQLTSANRLYLLDYGIMHGVSCKRGRALCAPLVLLLHTEKRQLRPIAIQLRHEPNETSPIFLPTDPVHIWLQAKLWVNLSDACHHMIVGRLLTHMILESVYVSLRRNLAQSHPIYQLLAPHFRSILPVTRKLKEWTFENGWIARNIQLNHKGIKQLLRRAFKQWRFDVQANLYRELESRGVYNPHGLGNYPYRQDALLIHRIIEKYVNKFVRFVYPGGTEDLLQDTELQSWRHEIASPMEEGGLGLVGVPGSSTKFRSSGDQLSDFGYSDSPEVFGLVTVDETVKFLVGLLHLIVIVTGSALRLPMFDEYGFPAHYPLSLFGAPPSDPGVSESGLLNSRVASSASSLSNTLGTERIVASLPNRQMTVEIVLYSRLASRVQQSVLGQYESDFLFKPQAVTILEEFRKDLADAVEQVDANNLSRDMHHQYRALDPSVMPNYPGI